MMNSRTRIAVRIAPMAAVALLAGCLLPAVARAELATAEEARTVAESYVDLILAKDGRWGAAESARVLSVEPFTRGDRVLGYFCPVEPVGYLVLGLYKELAPIRAYSVRFDLDPSADTGMTDLLKVRLERLYGALEGQLGRAIAPTDELAGFLPVDFRPAWSTLTDAAFDARAYEQPLRTRATGMDYQEGDELMSTTWYQKPPYNDQCPDMGCSYPEYGYYNTNAVVGCVATAGAQTMKFWNWPPAGVGSPYDDPYDWPNMCDTYRYDYQSDVFRDGQGQIVSQAQIDAVAEISREVGRAVDMDYGCSGSGAVTADMEGVYQGPYRYDDECDVRLRPAYSFIAWFELLKAEFNANRVVQYRIPDHSINADGWKEEQIGTTYYWFHIVYGWNGSNDGWVSPDEIPGGNPNDEYVVREIYPENSVGPNPSSTYGPPSYPYRYFDRDVHSAGAAFMAGQFLQVQRSGFLLENTSATTGIIQIQGSTAANTVVFLNGDLTGDSRIRVCDGDLKVYAGGQMVIR
jgi:hypothetical protein